MVVWTIYIDVFYVYCMFEIQKINWEFLIEQVIQPTYNFETKVTTVIEVVNEKLYTRLSSSDP